MKNIMSDIEVQKEFEALLPAINKINREDGLRRLAEYSNSRTGRLPNGFVAMIELAIKEARYVPRVYPVEGGLVLKFIFDDDSMTVSIYYAEPHIVHVSIDYSGGDEIQEEYPITELTSILNKLGAIQKAHSGTLKGIRYFVRSKMKEK